MPLNTPEQILVDFIRSNAEVRDFWNARIAKLPGLDFEDDSASWELESQLTEYYWESPENIAPIAALLGEAGLSFANPMNVADELLGVGLINELPHIIADNDRMDQMQSTYFISVHGKQSGPFTLFQLKSMWGSGQLTADTQFYSEARSAWTPLSSLVEGSAAVSQVEQATSSQTVGGGASLVKNEETARIPRYYPDPGSPDPVGYGIEGATKRFKQLRDEKQLIEKKRGCLSVFVLGASGFLSRKPCADWLDSCKAEFAFELA
jgi:hypothetical protein